MMDRLNTTYPIYFPQSTINLKKVNVKEEVRRLEMMVGSLSLNPPYIA